MNSRLSILRQYAAIMTWLVADSALRFRRQTVMISLAGMAAGFLHLGGFLMVGAYALRLAEGGAIGFGALQVDPRQSPELLIWIAIVAGICLLSAAALAYWARISTVHLGRLYEQCCADRVLGSAGGSKGLLGMPVKQVVSLCKRDSRVAGRVLRILVESISPIVIGIAATAVLVWMETALTLALVAMGTSLLVVQSGISRAASRHTLEHESRGRYAAAEFRSVVVSARQGGQPIVSCAKSESIQKYYDSFEGRLQALAASQLASQVFTAVIIFLVFVVLGWGVLVEEGSWTRLLVYVVAMRAAASGMQVGFSKLTQINRFYGQIRRYRAVVLGEEILETAGATEGAADDDFED